MALIEDVFSDLERLLMPVAGESRSGMDLDGTLELNALEMAALEPEQPVVEGVERTDERNWRQIYMQACGLLEKSKDLRVAATLTRALLQLDGLPGFCAGVCFMGGLVERFWAEVYPRLDAEDGDPTMRINAIHELLNDANLNQLRVARLFAADKIGTVTVNDLLLATASPLGRPELSQSPSHIVFSVIDALGAETVKANLVLIQDTREQVTKLIQYVSKQTGAYLQFDAVKSSKKGGAGLLDAVASGLGVESDRLSSAKSARQGVDTGEPDGESDTAAGAGRRNLGEIARREDVIMLLERICAYYARVEPSSPVPLLLQRAKRLATMDFLAIVRDLADQGLPQVGTVAGIQVE